MPDEGFRFMQPLCHALSLSAPFQPASVVRLVAMVLYHKLSFIAPNKMSIGIINL